MILETRIVDRYRSGERVIDIAQALSVDKVTVIEHLNRAEVERRPRGMSEGQVDEAVRLYASGLSLARVGERLGFSARTIRTMILRRGIKTRDPHGRER